MGKNKKLSNLQVENFTWRNCSEETGAQYEVSEMDRHYVKLQEAITKLRSDLVTDNTPQFVFDCVAPFAAKFKQQTKNKTFILNNNLSQVQLKVSDLENSNRRKTLKLPAMYAEILLIINVCNSKNISPIQFLLDAGLPKSKIDLVIKKFAEDGLIEFAQDKIQVCCN